MNDNPALLQAIRDQLTHLNALLVDESRTLQGNTPERLPELTQQKEVLLGNLSRLWTALASSHGIALPFSRERLAQALAPVLSAAQTPLWQEILELADVAEQQNRLNGKLIEEQLRRTQSALEILQTFSSRRNLYGADGRSEGLFTGGQIIDTA